MRAGNSKQHHSNVQYDWDFTKDGRQHASHTYSIIEPDDAAIYTSCAPAYLPPQSVQVSGNGTWAFTDDKNQLIITDTITRTYDVIELHNTQVRLAGTFAGQYWEITLKQK